MGLRLGFITFFCIVSVSWCLTGVKVIIPTAVKLGDTTALRCLFDLEGDQLYSVKWYKGAREFYRYTPRENPPTKMFAINGLQVFLPGSNEHHVELRNVSMENSGPYSCEISADAPSFFTGIGAGVLQVVEVPKHDPQITGLKHRYKIGETVKAECISKQSRPPANLTWLVNDEPSEAARIRRHHSRTSDNELLYNAHSLLRLQVNEDLFTNGRLKIRCVASVHNIYYRSSEKSIDLERQRPRRPNLESTPLPTITWEYALPAERYPQSTLIFTAASSNSGTGYAITPTVPLILFCVYRALLR